MGRKQADVRKYFDFDSSGKAAKCKFCKHLYKHINATKMLKHLEMKCAKCPLEVRRCVKQIKQGSKVPVRRNSEEFEVSAFQSTRSTSSQSPVFESSASTVPLWSRPRSSTSSNMSMTTFIDTMNTNEQESLNVALARAIYVTGTPLMMVEHPLWINLFKELRPSYKLPTRKAISTKYLDMEYLKMQETISTILADSPNLNLQCDGWSNIRNEGILNFVVTTPKPFFVDFINTSGNRQTSEYLGDESSKILNKFDPEKFFVVIGDNAANIRKAFRIVQGNYPHLVVLGCAAHLLHLLCSDVLKCESVVNLLKKVVDSVKIIKRSHILTALFTKISKEKNCNTSLLLPCKTRWGSYLVCLESMITSKVTLQTLAVSEEASSVLHKDLRAYLLDDTFWNNVLGLIDLLRPVVSWIHKLQSDEPMIHRVYDGLIEIQKNIEISLPSSPLSEAEGIYVMKKIDERSQFALGPIHLAAALLDPVIQGKNLTQEQQLDAVEFLDKIASDMGVNILTELAGYRSRTGGMWGKPFLWKNVSQMSPIMWWKGMCGNSDLSRLAIRVLSAPVTSAATERTFSTFSWIHNKRRNKLTSDRAGKLTFVSHNWKLMNHAEEREVMGSPALPFEPLPSSSHSHSDTDSYYTYNDMEEVEEDEDDPDEISVPLESESDSSPE